MSTTERIACAEASAWIVRLHGPLRTPELEAGFRAWLAADPENGRQFEVVTEVWDAGAMSTVGRVKPQQNLPGRSSSRKGLLAAVWAMLAVGAGFWGVRYFWLNPSYSTGIGEQRVVRLSDGTRITLNSNSKLGIDYNTMARRIRLEQGEALFVVAKDPRRPFFVIAGKNRVTALGTAFVVRLDGDRTAITLVEGKVAVYSSSLDITSDLRPSASPHSKPSPSPGEGALQGRMRNELILTPGERLTLAAVGAPRLDKPRIETITAWQRGQVVLDDMALADAVVEMNRYDQTVLVVDDPALATIKVSGIYHAGDSETFAGMIARHYRLKLKRENGRIHLTQ